MCRIEQTWSMQIYKGEGQMIVVPLIKHIGGYSVHSADIEIIKVDEAVNKLGACIDRCIRTIKNSEVSTMTSKEQEEYAVWHRATKCKGYKKFCQNYNMCSIIKENGNINVYSSNKGIEFGRWCYFGAIKDIYLPLNATADELAVAVYDVLLAADEKYSIGSLAKNDLTKTVHLLGGPQLTIIPPKDKHFEDIGDGGAAEIYQCYSYVAQEGAKPSGEIYVGMAAELNCNLEEANIRKCWEEMYGKTEYFEFKQVNYGIYKLRAEMRNKEVHRISYLVRQEEDLLLECTMNVNQPSRRKKIDERMTRLFEKFALTCTLN